MTFPHSPRTVRPHSLYFAMTLAFMAGCALVLAEPGERVIFEDPGGRVLDNWTPWFPGHVLFDNPVQLSDFESVVIDFSVPPGITDFLYSHRSGWTTAGQAWSQYRVEVVSGRQTVTLPLRDFTNPLDHTVGVYFSARDVVLYSVTLSTTIPDTDPPPGPGPNRVIVSGPTIELQRQVGRTWLGATEICGEVEYVYVDDGNADNPLNGTVYVLRFGECDEG